MRILPLLFQCLFYTGSWVPEKEYDHLMTRIRSHPLIRDARIHKFMEKPERDRNDTILIGHSLGGYFALRDAARFPDRVAGVILLNSHFNSRGVMPYPGVPIKKVSAPVLTILGGEDDRLPIRKAMDDAWGCAQEGVFDKYFIVNKDHNHFTGITYTKGQDKVVGPIFNFIQALATRNFTDIRRAETHRNRFRPELYDLSDDALVASQPVNILDAIMHIVVPRKIWRLAHFLWFITCKPDQYMGYMFVDDDHIYLKGNRRDETRYEHLLREWTRDVPTRILDYRLPKIHPSILIWLFFPLKPKWDGMVMDAPRVVMDVDNQTTYYKIPNPRKFFKILPEESFFDFP